MIYLPAACERCSSLALVASEDCIDGKALCGSCGGVVVVLPGAAYPEGDSSLFHELCALVAGAPLEASAAEQLALAIEEASQTVGAEQALGVAAFWLPPVGALAALLNANPLRARQVCSMLQTILHSHGRKRVSGFGLKHPTAVAKGSRSHRFQGKA